jgi:hypothetical protein
MAQKSGLPKEIDNYLNFIYAVARENQVSLLVNEKGKKVVNEVGELCNDAIDYMSYFAKKQGEGNESAKYTMAGYTYRVLMPQSSALYSNLLLGNPLTCFSQLELMTRALAVSYGADSKFQRENLATEKMRQLVQKDGKHINTEKRLKELDGTAFELWKQLCDDWANAKGIMDKPVQEIIEKPGIPVWALSSPVTYAEIDMETIDLLGMRVAAFRNLLKLGMDKWKREVLKVMD